MTIVRNGDDIYYHFVAISPWTGETAEFRGQATISGNFAHTQHRDVIYPVGGRFTAALNFAGDYLHLNTAQTWVTRNDFEQLTGVYYRRQN